MLFLDLRMQALHKKRRMNEHPPLIINGIEIELITHNSIGLLTFRRNGFH